MPVHSAGPYLSPIYRWCCHPYSGGEARGLGAGLIRGSKVSAGVGVEVGAVGGGEL